MRKKIKRPVAFLSAFAMVMAMLLYLPNGVFSGTGFGTRASAEEITTADVWNGSVASSFAGGSGTQEEPYQIATGAQLAYFAKVVNATAYADNEYAKAYYQLTADIDLNNRTLGPIGKTTGYTRYFNGCFDGNNKTISNYSGSYGLFYNVGGDVTIKDLTLANVNISGSSYIGGLVYMVNANMGTSALISNCHISGTIKSDTYSAVGLVYNAWSPLTIEDCSNSANITGQSYSAGILGGNYTKSTFDDYFVTIRNCTNSGKIVNTSTSSGSVGAAGIAGSLQYGKTLIENCVNTGEIVAQNGGEKYAGIVSLSSSTAGNTIRYCENYGNVTCDVAKTSIYTAGICAYASYSEIYDCSNVGTIHNDESALYCGGIVARRASSSDTSRGSVYNCFNAGTIEPSYGGQIIGSEDTLSNIYDNYYVNGNLSANSVNNQNNYRVSQEQAESGCLAFVMNGLTSGNVWKQKLGTDIYPKINGSEDIVYANGNCSAKVTEYSNTPLSMDDDKNHDLILVSASDADCGHNGYKEHYECKSCNAFFENVTDNAPVRKSDFITGTATGNHQTYDENGLCAVCGNAYEKPEKDENGVYVIKNTGNFIWYANAINNYNYISIPVGDAEIQLDGFDAKLEADIDLSLVYSEKSGKSWEPIAYDYSNYLNELDGQGHTINGLYINSASLKYAGLVKTMSYEKAYIHDIVFTNVNINAPRADYVGTVTGKMKSLKTAPCIENCIVESGTINGKTYVGGLVGYICSNNADKFQQENKNIINNCANFAEVNSTSYAGGLVGYTEANGKNVNIANCYNVGVITGTTSGDIIGKISDNTSVVNCFYLGSTAFGENDVSATAEQKTAEQFKSGEVAYLLNGSTSEGTFAWGQMLTGETPDEYPVLGGEKVYLATTPCTGYSNTETKEHKDSDNDGICDDCNKFIRSVVREVSATLNGDIGLNYYIALPESVTADEGTYVLLTVNGQTTEVYLKDLTAEENGTYKFTCWLTAKEMSDAVTFQLYDGNGALIDIYKKSGDKIEGASFEYSLAEYFDTLSSDESIDNEALKNLAYATLVYGVYAQNAFNHNADPSLDGSELATVTAETLESFKMTKSAEIPAGLKLTEMTLILETETTLRLYFKSENIENYTFKLDGTGVTLNKIEEESLYYVEIANISAKDLDTNHTLIINDECELNFSALSYAYAALKTGKNDNLCNVVKALYKYNEAANTYFGK